MKTVRLVNIVGSTNTEEAKRLTNEYIDKLEGYKGIFDEPELKEFKRIIISDLGTTYKIKNAKDLIREGKMEAKLKELAKLPASPDNIETAEVYKSIYNNHQALIHAQETLLMTQAAKRVNGTFTDGDLAALKYSNYHH